MDSTDVEVYGSGKQGVAYDYAGQRAGRPHLANLGRGRGDDRGGVAGRQ
ncbi:MAG: hypothetical protein ACOYBY_15480 [Dermatophilaceae bacterium]